jgi:hypothetical protein
MGPKHVHAVKRRNMVTGKRHAATYCKVYPNNWDLHGTFFRVAMFCFSLMGFSREHPAEYVIVTYLGLRRFWVIGLAW